MQLKRPPSIAYKVQAEERSRSAGHCFVMLFGKLAMQSGKFLRASEIAQNNRFVTLFSSANEKRKSRQCVELASGKNSRCHRFISNLLLLHDFSLESFRASGI